MSIDLEQIKKNYEGFDDYKIEYLAKNEINSLDPEVVKIIKDEIKKRGLDSNLNKGIEAQTKELTDTELLKIKSKISKLPCPECGGRNTPLIGIITREVKSFIIPTFYIKTPLILCETCATKKRKRAIISTALLGWWGIPIGIFRTPFVLVKSFSDIKNQDIVNDIVIQDFIIKNIGEIQTNWDKENELVACIRHKNATN